MHQITAHRLPHLLQRFADDQAPSFVAARIAAHDMLVLNSRPDLTPEYPPGPSQRTPADYLPARSQSRP